MEKQVFLQVTCSWSSSENVEPMSRLGITRTSSLSSPPQFNIATAFIASSPPLTHRTIAAWVLNESSAARANQVHVQVCCPLHSQENIVLTIAPIQFVESRPSYKWPAHNYFYIHWVLAFSMLTHYTHPQVGVKNLCAHRCPLLLPVRVFYSKEKNTEPAFSPSPFSVLQFYNLFTFFFLQRGGGRVHTVSTQKCMTLKQASKWQANINAVPSGVCKEFRATLFISLSQVVCEVYYTSRPW